MELVLAVLAWIGIVLGALLALLLLVPLDARAEGRIGEDVLDGRVRVRWGGGVVSVRLSAQGGALYLFGIRLFRLKGDRGRPRPVREPEEPRRRDKRRRRALWYWRHRRTLLRAGLRLLRAVHPRGRLSGRIGLGDPTDDAAVHGLLAWARGRWPRLALDVECDWVEEVVELEGRVRAIIWPVELLVVLLVVRLSGDVRRALREPA